ncbi:SpoIID/LytB domain-containing protein [Kineococcus rubinsiae]|uniref:SpoIID/LytB domain-containing protein n=1 Tax=Kineococcus rubinsiae TaxID=2609562 RepID=UPI00143067CA|nr:SpoIID/LytB domain-containing protein [Kineococcus rubinsiae]NIZ91503.1 SpoIID/LytB domain-containing protein [Kineococcus rubinsiae]
MHRRRTPRRSALVTVTATASLLATLGGGLLTATSAQADEVRPVPAGGQWTFSGHGFGHGIGMSQWGAQSRAVAGQSHQQILDAYYPGTSAGSHEDRLLRVGLTAFTGPSVTVAAPGANPLTLSTSGRVLAPGQRLTLASSAGSVIATATPGSGGVAGWTETWTSSPTLSSPDGVLLVRGDGSSTRYAGTVRVVLGASLTVVNDVRLETYLRGVVPAESPSSWSAQALQAQAVAARSYALSVLRPGAETDICDTTSCQVYRGAESRSASGAVTWSQPASTNAAIAATAGEVRTYGGNVAFTQFSSSNGGWTVAGSKPYLTAAADPFSSPTGKAAGDPVASWSTTVPAAAFDAGCAPGGRVTSLVITARDGRGADGGRVTKANLVCTNGAVAVTGTKLRQLGGLRSDWFTLPSPIALAHVALGGNSGPLGAARTGEQATPAAAGAFQHFAGGSIYFSAATGAHDVRGAIRDRWAALGWENGLGFPTSGDSRTPAGTGWYTHFQGGSVYSTAATGTHEVRGAIRQRWAALGWENGLGYPVTGDVRTPNGAGYYTHFQGGSIYFSAATGAHEVRGAIRDAWARQGWETGPLGFPTSGDQRTPAGTAWYTHFQGGSVYASSVGGVHAVRGPIRDAWAAQGWETGTLGYPVGDQQGSGTLSQRFQGGTLTFDPATGRTTRS